jgi:transglutaminase-like putative cysteine protease
VRLLTVRHITRYAYSEPVGFGEHRMMFRPRESHDLRLVSTRLEITPRPSGLRWLHDVFDNSVAIASFDDASASELRFDSTVTLEHLETALPEYALDAAARAFPFAYSDEERPDLVGALTRQYPSDDLSAWTARLLDAGSRTTMGLLLSMTGAINDAFTYLRRIEKGVQSPGETLRLRTGSCRDFAVLMIEAARSLGVAARFVSGYIFVQDASRATTVGGGATHAWMQAYLPGAGWVDFDPTNSIVGNRNLIRVAVAWDHRNALPLWGTFVGPRSAFRGMDVTVSVVEEPTPVLLAPQLDPHRPMV